MVMKNDYTTHMLLNAAEGDLIAWLATLEPPGDDRTEAMEALAQLHRSRQLDAFEHLQRAADRKQLQPDYTSWVQTCRELIPLLDDDAGHVASALVRLAETRWGATLPHLFIDWCLRDQKRIDEVLTPNPKREIPNFALTGALIAGLRTNPRAYLDLALAYTRDAGCTRQAGIRALGSMPHQDNTLTQQAIATLAGIVNDDEANVQDRAAALTACLELVQCADERFDALASSLVEKAIRSGRAQLLLVPCQIITRFGAQIHDGLMPSLLQALQAVQIDTPEVCSHLDSALYRLLTDAKAEEAINCIASLLRRNGDKTVLNLFPAVAHHLASQHTNLMPALTCQWLLTGDTTLCSTVRELLTLNANQRFTFDFDPGNRTWPDKRTVFLARKAVGWLMPHATAPASFLVCLLRQATNNAAKEIAELLFDPLLINYPIAVREYLEANRRSLPKQARILVEEILARDKSYKKALKDVGFVAELQPTEHQRWIHATRENEKWSDIRREAERTSILGKIARRQTLLYGVRAITYVNDPNGEVRRLDTDLKTVSYTSDNPMGWVYDPFGLDFMLRFFKVERSPE